MKVTGLGSWNFHADNLDAMMKFYQDVLGAEVRVTHAVGGVKVVRLRLGPITTGVPPSSAGAPCRL